MMTQMSKRRSLDLAALFRPAFYKALCDPTRVSILVWLAQQRAPRNVSDIASSSCCNIDLSVVSRHLACLRDAGIIESARRGREVIYRVRTDALVDTLRGLADAIEGCCPITSFEPEADRT